MTELQQNVIVRKERVQVCDVIFQVVIHKYKHEHTYCTAGQDIQVALADRGVLYKEL